ncbi:MAG: PIN domain nuclease [Propionibacteriaceae bacterium]|nr:PIN domain nuclease [Propionibacteriaceae bacterium]
MSDIDLPDVNVLVALLNPRHIYHRVAQEWFANAVSVATTPITELGFLRVSLVPAVSGKRVQTADALASLNSLRSHERACFLPDDSSLGQATIDLSGWAGHKQTTDLHLVNLASRHKARLVTLDQKIRPSLVPADQQKVLVLI